MVRPQQSIERVSLLGLIRRSGDANLGAALIRLAARAAAEHRAQEAEASAAGSDEQPVAADDQAAPLRRLCRQIGEEGGR